MSNAIARACSDDGALRPQARDACQHDQRARHTGGASLRPAASAARGRTAQEHPCERGRGEGRRLGEHGRDAERVADREASEPESSLVGARPGKDQHRGEEERGGKEILPSDDPAHGLDDQRVQGKECDGRGRAAQADPEAPEQRVEQHDAQQVHAEVHGVVPGWRGAEEAPVERERQHRHRMRVRHRRRAQQLHDALPERVDDEGIVHDERRIVDDRERQGGDATERRERDEQDDAEAPVRGGAHGAATSLTSSRRNGRMVGDSVSGVLQPR
jgi:hypothetical protein